MGFIYVSMRNLYVCYLCLPFRLATPAGFHVTHIPEGEPCISIAYYCKAYTPHIFILYQTLVSPSRAAPSHPFVLHLNKRAIVRWPWDCFHVELRRQQQKPCTTTAFKDWSGPTKRVTMMFQSHPAKLLRFISLFVPLPA